ncbi:transthyretin-like family protein [Actinomadura algeriensis]|uniref:Uncharacterized protein n=1 Tax=Actinomadura algeriensis TaxID=1679523 RepID=A0ABR9JPP6_9ACTN|nr:hypothetical protein [Actinomadura algeriensis]MBE1532527.1 hypothetical protein [Actinomadura algeriensis]
MTALIAVVAVTTALLGPGTAHADATDVSLSVDFDNLSPDRTATITLKAKSGSGVTGVEAAVENWRNGQWAAVGTVPLALVDGTENDGTWRAEHRADIETHPGTVRFNVEVTTADGAQTSRTDDIDNCYRGEFTDLTTTPEVIDYDYGELTVEGRLMVRKTRDVLEPAANVTVRNGPSDFETRADGSFVLTDPNYKPKVWVTGVPWVCNTFADAPQPRIDVQATEVSASIVTPQPVEAGATVSVEGTVRRQADQGLVPVRNVSVSGYVHYGTDRQDHLATIDSANDGTFRFDFTAAASGPVTLISKATPFLASDRATAGTLTVTGTPRFVDFATALRDPKTGETEDTVTATGRLVVGEAPVQGERVHLERRLEGYPHWTVMGTGTTAEDGSFSITGRTQLDGYWRVRSEGTGDNEPTESESKHVDARALTYVRDFDARPDGANTVAVGGRLTLGGDDPAASLPVYVYFRPVGASAWQYKGITSTGDDGTFAATFPTGKDGDWTAWYFGDAERFASVAPVKYVDADAEYETRFAEFGVAPTQVESGGTVKVTGTLNRFADGIEPEAVAGKPVALYFMQAGSGEWKQVATATTGADGRFEKSLTATHDGYWTAWFWGDEEHARTNAAMKYMDVR